MRKIVNNELASIQNKRKNEVLKLEKIEKKRKAAAERETKRHQKRLQAKKKKEE